MDLRDDQQSAEEGRPSALSTGRDPWVRDSICGPRHHGPLQGRRRDVCRASPSIGEINESLAPVSVCVHAERCERTGATSPCRACW
eukprot:356645-Prymnesium_polylepis.1